MHVYDNPGPDDWDIPLLGLTVKAGTRVEVFEPGEEQIHVDATGQATIVEAPATPEGQ